MSNRRPSRPLERLWLMLVAAAMLFLAVENSAWAWARGFTVAQNSSPSNSLLGKTVEASCPSGAGTVGTGAFVSPSLSNLGVSRLGGGVKATARAAETDSLNGGWSLSVRGFCLFQQSFAPTAGTAAPFVKAVEIVRADSPLNSSGKSVSAQCPGGKTVISGGGRIAASVSDIAFTGLQRITGGTGWRVSAHEVDATSASWQLTASAVCANITTETQTSDYVNVNQGRRVVEVERFGTSTSPRTQVATCPQGQFVFGGYAEVLPPRSAVVPPSDVVLTRSAPATGSPATSWSAEARETDGTTATWRLLAAAICAPLNAAPAAP